MTNQGGAAFGRGFSSTRPIRTPWQLAVADFDSDGRPDFAAVQNARRNGEDHATIGIYLNQGDGSFSYQERYPGQDADGIAAADFDGDGQPDLAIASGYDHYARVFLNNLGAFSKSADFSAARPSAVAVGDFDADGNVDIATASPDAGPWEAHTMNVFWNRGGVQFVSRPTLAIAALPKSMASADLDGDGREDVVVAGKNAVSVFLATAGASFAARADYPTSASVPWQVALADLDGDLRPDIAVTDDNNNAVEILSTSCRAATRPTWTRPIGIVGMALLASCTAISSPRQELTAHRVAQNAS